MAQTAFNPLTMPLSGVHSISASAGTGKTYAITTLYLRFLLDPLSNCPVDSILVTTFTEAATAELKDRLRGRLKAASALLEQFETTEAARSRNDADDVLIDLLENVGGWHDQDGHRVQERIEDALLSFDQAPVFTIHGFCHRILKELVFETGSRFDAELVTSIGPLVDEAVGDFAARWWTASESPLTDWLTLDASLWDSMEKVAWQALDHPDVAVVPDGDDLETLLESDLVSTFHSRVTRLEQAWEQTGAAAVQLLSSAVASGVMNRNKYGRAGQIERAVEFVQTVISHRDPGLFDLDSSSSGPTQRRLAQSAINAGAKKGEHPPQHEVYQRFDELIDVVERMSRHRAALRTALLARLASAVREHVDRRKRESGVMSFSDLLHQVDNALGGERNEFLLDALRDRYRVAMVDEFQDTDPVQFRIFRQIFVAEPQGLPSDAADRAFVMIGDPKQSIYRFRGADIHACLQAIRETPVSNRHQMGTNWRSDRSLVDAVQAVFQSASNPFLSSEIGLPEIQAHFDDRLTDAPAFSVTVVPNPFATEKKPQASKDDALRRILPQLADDVVRQLKSEIQILDDSAASVPRSIQPRDIAILCRTGRELRLVQQHLADRGVPAVLQTDESVFDSAEALAIVHVLKAVLSAGAHGSMAAALQTSLFGCDADQLDSLQRDEFRLSEWNGLFHRWRDCWNRDGFAAMWSQLLAEQRSVARLAGQITGERKITNYLHLGELLHNAADAGHFGPGELLRWLEQMVVEPDRRTEDQAQLRLETDAAAVQLCTIHKSKGLEYGIVYCPTLWAVFRGKSELDVVLAKLDIDEQPLESHELDVGSELMDSRREQDLNEQQAEDRRLLYVALTRAKHQCHVYWAAVERAGESALGHFLSGGESKLNDAALEFRVRDWLRGLGVARVEMRGARQLSAESPAGQFTRLNSEQPPLACRSIRRPVIQSLMQTSFTSLARSVSAQHAEEIADRDAVATLPLEPDDVDRVASTGGEVPLAGLLGGRQLGEVVHQVFEDILGSDASCDSVLATLSDNVRERLERGMRRHRLDSDWLETLTESVTAGLTQPLALSEQSGLAGCSLLKIDASQRTCEMPFLMCLGSSDEAEHLSSFAEAFSQSSNEWVRGYAARVGDISVSQVQGFLAGFIDLVFEHEGRWFILDYKTNNLGPGVADYSTDHLREAMIDHDYILQYHLYAVALDALLRQRIDGYSYDRHFGGVLYLFVRAVLPQSNSLGGVFFDRPDQAVVTGLAESIMGQDRLHSQRA